MDFMKSSTHHRAMDTHEFLHPSSQRKSKKTKSTKDQSKKKETQEKKPVIHRPELNPDHGAIHYEYQIPYPHSHVDSH